MAKQKKTNGSLKELVLPHMDDFLNLMNEKLKDTGLDKHFQVDQVRFKAIQPLNANCIERTVCRKVKDSSGREFVKCVNEIVCT
jgi:hypothetical protein